MSYAILDCPSPIAQKHYNIPTHRPQLMRPQLQQNSKPYNVETSYAGGSLSNNHDACRYREATGQHLLGEDYYEGGGDSMLRRSFSGNRRWSDCQHTRLLEQRGHAEGGNLLHVGKALDAALANDDPRVAELHVLYQSAAEVDKQLLGAGRQPAQRGGGGEGRKSWSRSEGGRWEEIWVLWGASRMPAPSSTHTCMLAQDDSLHRGASEGERWEEIWVLRGASRMRAPSSTHTCMLAQDDSLHRRPVKAGDGRKSGSYSAQPACPLPACTGGQ